MKTLVVDDEFISRKILAVILGEFGSVDIAVNGVEAQDAIALALDEGEPYDLICLDIQMPGMDGHEVLQKIREKEEDAGIYYTNGVRVVMTTVMKDIKNLMAAYNNLCDGYITKPIERTKLLEVLKELELIQ